MCMDSCSIVLPGDSSSLTTLAASDILGVGWLGFSGLLISGSWVAIRRGVNHWYALDICRQRLNSKSLRLIQRFGPRALQRNRGPLMFLPFTHIKENRHSHAREQKRSD